MFVDEVEVIFQAGNGHPGKASFYPGWKSGPAGGNGGNGGNIYITVTSDLTTLRACLETVIPSVVEESLTGDSNEKDPSTQPALSEVEGVGMTRY